MRRTRISAAVTIAAIGTVTLGIVAGTARASSGSWREVYLPSSGEDATYTSIAATSTTNAWAVGVNNLAGTGLAAAKWNGSSWNKLTVPGASSFAGDGYPQVAASSAGNVWITGLLTNGTQEILRWGGLHWHTIPLPPDHSTGPLVVLSATSAWMLGEQSLWHGAFTTTIWHWNGTKWQGYSVGFVATALTATAANSIWAAGVDKMPFTKTRMTAAHWNGTRWITPVMPHPYDYAWEPEAAAGPGGSVWFIGDNQNPENPAAQPGPAWALHWNGKQWKQTPAAPGWATSGAATSGYNLLLGGGGEEWNGSAWLSNPFTTGSRPQLSALATIPATRSVWGAGSDYGLMIAAFGPVP